MEAINKILPLLWQIVEKHKCAVNINTFDDLFTVNILFGRKSKQFSHKDSEVVIAQLTKYAA